MSGLFNENIKETLNQGDINGNDVSGVNVNNINIGISETANVVDMSQTANVVDMSKTNNTSVSTNLSSIINNFFYGTTGTTTTATDNKTNTTATTTNYGTHTNIFSLSNILFLIWFLLIYLVIFYLIKSFYKDDNDNFKETMALSRGIDIFIFGLLIILILYSYWSLSEKDKQNLIGYCLEWTHDFYSNPNTLFECLVFIVLFYLFIYLFGVPMTKETRPVSIYFIEQKLWIILISVIIVDFFVYVLNIPIVDMIFGNDNGLTKAWYDLRSEIKETEQKPKTKTEDKQVKPKERKPEVFNISNNLYTYSDAQAVCKSFNAELATIDQIHTAYDEGAEWCVNSWSANQQVLYPTQKSTYDRLQKIKGQENTCGRTGVNGGYVKDKSLRYGVNCYGIKPNPTNVEKSKLTSAQGYVPPKSKEDMILEAKVNFWKNNKDDYMTVSPFNNDKWSYQSI